MTCREFSDFIGDYLSAELSPDIQARFESHLSICPNCVSYLRSYQETARLGQSAFASADAPLPAEIPEDLIHAIVNARPKPGS